MLKFPAVLITHLLIYCYGNLSDQLSVKVALLLSAFVPIWREFVKVTVSRDEIFQVLQIIRTHCVCSYKFYHFRPALCCVVEA